MPKLGRTTPCSDCPWRVNSRPGWLGEDKPISFFRSSITNESGFPCHKLIDYNDRHWRETQLPDADYCAGQLIFFRNWLKMPKRQELYTAVLAVEPSDFVFATPEEFLRHHVRDGYSDKMVQLALWPFPDPSEESPDDV
jgi:hypothetical protein